MAVDKTTSQQRKPTAILCGIYTRLLSIHYGVISRSMYTVGSACHLLWGSREKSRIQTKGCHNASIRYPLETRPNLVKSHFPIAYVFFCQSLWYIGKWSSVILPCSLYDPQTFGKLNGNCERTKVWNELKNCLGGMSQIAENQRTTTATPLTNMD